MSVAVQKDIASWLEFNILNASEEPIVLVESSQINVFYKKYGALTFTQKIDLITVTNPEDPQEGENFVEIGFGVYAIYFTNIDLNTSETFTWAVLPSDRDVLDFKQWVQQIDIVPNTDVTATVNTINTNVTTLQTNVNTGFTATDTDLTDIQATLTSLTATINTMEDIVNEISANQPSSISVSFVG